MLHNLRFFFSSKCRLFHNATFFGSYIIHILNTGVLKFKRKFWRQRVNGYSYKLNIPCIHCSILVLVVAASTNYSLCTEIIQTPYHSSTWFQQNTRLIKTICSKFYPISMHACMYFYFGFSDM